MNVSKSIIRIGVYSANASIDVSVYEATSASEFLFVPNASSIYARDPNYGAGGVDWGNGFAGTASATEADLSLSNNILTLTVPKIKVTVHAGGFGSQSYSSSANVSGTLYYIGDILDA